MMADDILLRPAAGFLELLGCRAKRRDLAQFSGIVPSVGEILQFGVFQAVLFSSDVHTMHESRWIRLFCAEL